MRTHITHRRRRARASRRGGFTLVEIVVAGAVFATTALMTMGSIISSVGATSLVRESAVATDAAQGMMEELRLADFEDIFVLYNNERADDPGGPGTAHGSDFEVDGLSACADDVDGIVGEIVFPTTAASPGVLRENLDQPFGILDLSGDGAIDGADHSDDHVILPVQIRIRWTGSGGESVVQLTTLLSDL